ncbi:MAG TPA: 3'-5' exonuclease [bacterium]|nr:3'-5' exonuclease [bacterium]
MPLTDEQAREIGEEESSRWKETHTAIVAELRRTSADYEEDRKLARELTSQIVASTRDEDKAALASDEAVAHGLTALRKDKSQGLDSLEEQPYFARVVTEELNEAGDLKEVEFRLGTASFPAQRIIDWRKAPISKLYYDFKEGDEFSETIQGRDREGTIKLRRSYHGRRDVLNIIETPRGTLAVQNGKWRVKDGGEPLSRTSGHDGHLPPILSLITAEQFELITKDAKNPIVIQGIAGSGKTTVALHRLAWLLHEDNSNAKAEKCLVVMQSPALKAYVDTTLPELKIHGVPIRTFQQWASKLVTELAGARPTGIFQKTLEMERFKSSIVCLQLMNKYVQSHPERDLSDWVADLFRFFQFLTTQEVFWPQWEEIRKQLKEQVARRHCEEQDDALILHLIYLERGYYPVRSAGSLGVCDHVVIDEAQDFGLIEIKALLNAVDQKRTVTIVGDLAQKIVMGRNFDSWETVLKDAGFENTSPIELTVSHRTTREILDLAGKLRGGDQPLPPGAQKLRSGPIPSFFKTDTAAALPNLAANWIRACQGENANALSAVICRHPKEAQALTEELRKLGLPSVRWGHREQFDFSPGVVITSIHQVKGLEFRNVLVLEPSEENYPPNEEGRNLLYVAATRAEVRVDFAGAKAPSPLLPRLPKGKWA